MLSNKGTYGFWLAWTAAFLIAFNIAAWLSLFYVGGLYAKLLGLGILAYTLGMRHAFDADHIAAIDNTTRKLVQEKKKPVGVGLFFSLGHSTVVVLLSLGLVIASTLVAHSIPSLENMGAIVGTTVSALFLYVIGILNVLIFIDIYRLYRKLSVEKYDQERLNELLDKRGLMNRIFGKRFKFIERSWQMYPVGFLFGLGFDTATEVALIAITGIAAANMPVAYVMVLPIMFTAGMTLLDTADSVVMLHAYNWAFSNALKKIYYNMTITAASVLVAFFIGGVEWIQAVAIEFNLNGGLWSYVENLDFGILGIGIVSIFVITWAISMALYRRKSARLAGHS